MKIFGAAFSIYLLFSLVSCEKRIEQHTGYIVQGYLNGVDATTASLYDSDNELTQSVAIRNNRFTVVGMSKDVSLHRLELNDETSTSLDLFLQNKDTIHIYGSLTSFKVYGSKIQNTLATYSETIEGFKQQSWDVLAQAKHLESLRKTLDSLDQVSLTYSISQIKNSNNEELSQLLFESINMDHLSMEGLEKLKLVSESNSREAWLSEINPRIDTFKAISARIEAEKVEQSKRTASVYRPLAPIFTGESILGGSVSLENVLQGKKAVLIDFWASWCKPCRMSTPYVRNHYQRYKNIGFDVITVSEDRNQNAWRAGVAEDQMSAWHHIYDDRMRIAGMYGARAIPHMVLIDAQGRIIQDKISITQLDRELKKIFR